ncbi:MAG: 50S ribosomal protein L7/L12 [Candidatus Pacebacteria bacterium]|nr:50S ribosomal protein L7/L12 [Candidatus Paceibacterota bacterium]MDD3072603.1 50S ribosomal protein L7/L12 [Candidatus Paceibacterota bacterium]MDD3728915.1 50S ribosomal protein L7/L12 [Candidatus Paceibacterota bacterium]MDD4201531.1 50S ribosomal protein L7/L12 [Candidatus Paceibacterota bacterium]MDD4467356.1 50S ribosomal protein L7/L12 [Candidatus Paceibacterota bacterium]
MAEENKNTSAAEEKAEKETVEVPKKFKGIVEEIEKMSVLDLSELVKVLEKKFGVSAAPQMMAMPSVAAGAPGASAEAEEKSSFNVELSAPGEKKLEVIKLIRDMLGKGLKEAKDFVDASSGAPQMIKEGATKEEAQDIKKKVEEAGGKVELK